MRNVLSPQLQIGQTDIANIDIDATSRDDIPLILLGLQHIYTTEPLRQAVFNILNEVIPYKTVDDTDTRVAVDADKGRPGMDQWAILVLGTLRLGLNADYDRIQELANQHKTLRMILGHGPFDAAKDYRLQTLKNNLYLFTPELMARINTEVIRAGYALLDLEVDAMIRERCDSFVLKTDVHFPTDIETFLLELKTFRQHAVRQIDQIKRRVIDGKPIPHDEKVFSLFQLHTEWISKGKAGVPVELGMRVCIVEDTHGFILHHRVLQQETDDKIALEMVNATQAKFPSLNACSFDKGFHSLDNQRDLKDTLEQVVLPKKGKRSRVDQAREYADDFVQAKKKHSAVESAINALQVHGLNKCPDHDIDGFERYAALAVLSRNIQVIGSIIRSRTREQLQKQAA